MAPETSRTRVRRLAEITAASRWNKRLHQLRRREVILRVGIIALTIILMAIFMRVWEPPFPYYVGETVRRDIVARVPFTTKNEEETRLNREIAMSRVPYIYIRNNDVQTLTDNMNKVAAVLKEAIKADSFEAMSPELRKNFEPPEGSQSSGGEEDQPFKFLRSTTKPPQAMNKPTPVPTASPAEARAIEHAEAASNQAKAEEDAKARENLPVPVAPSSITPKDGVTGREAVGKESPAEKT